MPTERSRWNDPGMAELLTINDLPADFEYPPLFIRVVEQGLIDLEPWHLLVGEHLRLTTGGLAKRYPSRSLVPFAYRQDNDDVACWEPAASSEAVVIIHDYASPGWETRGSFVDFAAWLRQAMEDLIEWD